MPDGMRKQKNKNQNEPAAEHCTERKPNREPKPQPKPNESITQNTRLDPGTENWMLSYKTTVVIALNKESREEVARFLVKGDNLFTVADRACTAETCGTSEGEETPVSYNDLLSPFTAKDYVLRCGLFLFLTHLFFHERAGTHGCM